MTTENLKTVSRYMNMQLNINTGQFYFLLLCMLDSDLLSFRYIFWICSEIRMNYRSEKRMRILSFYVSQGTQLLMLVWILIRISSEQR